MVNFDNYAAVTPLAVLFLGHTNSLFTIRPLIVTFPRIYSGLAIHSALFMDLFVLGGS